MRILGEIPHPACKITLFQWNNRYIVKLEQGFLEQTFKIDQFAVSSDDEMKKIIDEPFLQEALSRFSDMSRSMQEALQRA